MPPPLARGRPRAVPHPPRPRLKLVANGAYGDPSSSQHVNLGSPTADASLLAPTLTAHVSLGLSILHATARLVTPQVTAGAVPHIRVVRISPRYLIDIITTVDGWHYVQGGYGEGPTPQPPTQPPGGSVLIEVEISNGAGAQDFAIPWPSLPLLTPSEGVRVTVTDPSGGATDITGFAMLAVRPARYRATLPIPLEAPAGLYGCEIVVSHGGTQVSQRYGVYTVKAEAE